MKALSRKLFAFVSATLLISAAHDTATAQSPRPGSSIYGDQQSKTHTSETPTTENPSSPSAPHNATSPDAVDGPFAHWGIPTPPGAEGYEVNQATDDELNPQGLEEWHPTTNPNSEIIPGQMRSDREEIPAGIDKNEADNAEIREAHLADPDTPTLNARPGCSVYWPAPFEVCGLIKEKYDQVGGPTSFLLLPKSHELTNPDGIGKRSEFANGFIYWHPKTGAHTVSLPAAKVWARHGWERGFLRYPTTSDMDLGNQWFRQDFQGGHVYTHNALPATQASIQGAIYDKWESMGAQHSELGYPISDELTTPDGIGRYNVFEGGMIYWTPQHGAHSIKGGTGAIWIASGFEKSNWGYPTTDIYLDANADVKQEFSRGEINISDLFKGTETTLINGKHISNKYLELMETTLGIVTTFPDLSEIEDYPALQASRNWFPPQNSIWQRGLRNWYVNSPVLIPDTYVYDTSHKQKTLHDFCSYSRDLWGDSSMGNSTDTIADFRGPCAKHDMCYDRVNEYETRVVTCDPKLHQDLLQSCNSTYSERDKATNRGCIATADYMYAAVKYFQKAKHAIR